MALTKFGHWLEADWRVRAELPAPMHGEWYAGQGFTVHDTLAGQDVLAARVDLSDDDQVGVLVYATEIHQCANVRLTWEAWQELVAEVEAQRGRHLAARTEDVT